MMQLRGAAGPHKGSPAKAGRGCRPRLATIRSLSSAKAANGGPTNCSIDFLSLRGALFDIDGTLGESEHLHIQVYTETLIEAGFNKGEPITEAFFKKHISGRHNPEIAADLFPDKDLAWRNAWCDAREARFRKLAATSLAPVKGLFRFTKWMESRGLRRAAVTNAPRPNAEVMIAGLGLAPFFETMVIGDECTRGKPYPDPYQEGLIRIGLRHCPHQVLVLEDSPTGVAAAKAAGLPVVGLLTGQTRDALAAADLLVHDFDELMDLIDAQEAAQL